MKNKKLITYEEFWEYLSACYIKINLGGGLNFDETDGLSKFKKKFSDKKNIFYISKIISDQIKYSQTRDEFNLREKNYFLIGDAI